MARRPTSLLRETLLALLVLAVTALNFGHTSAVFAAGGRVVVTASSICGDPLSPSAGEHFACHACRPAAIALPPMPCAVEPAVFAATPVVYAEEGLVPAAYSQHSAALARGPPTA